MFVAYQTSITRQFEFVTRAIVNNPSFRVMNGGKDPGYDPGYDPIIGQNNRCEDRRRTFQLLIQEKPSPFTPEKEWVIPTGGGYYFVPSISALTKDIANPR